MRFLIIFFLFSLTARSQFFDSIPLERKLEFISFLREKRQWDDARFLIHALNQKENNDSLLLVEASFLLELRREKEAEALLDHNFKDLKPYQVHYCKYLLLKNHAQIMTGNYDSLQIPLCNHEKHKEEARLQWLAVSVLKKDAHGFDMVFNAFRCSDPDLSAIESAFYTQRQEMVKNRQKSTFLAAILSAIVPGSGKWYAAKPREALYAFMPVFFNFAQAGEGYYYAKLRSPHLYFFGAMGTIFYFSNIFGSAKTAQRKNLENDFIFKSSVEHEVSKLTKYY